MAMGAQNRCLGGRSKGIEPGRGRGVGWGDNCRHWVLFLVLVWLESLGTHQDKVSYMYLQQSDLNTFLLKFAYENQMNQIFVFVS